MKHNEEKVVYIEYHDKIPHSAITANEKGYMSFWDFGIFYKDKKNIRYYNSGGGGHISEINAVHVAEGCGGVDYWIDCSAKLKGEAINASKISEPYILEGYIGENKNPFHSDVSEETYSLDYCDRCNQWANEYCREHQYEDENDDYELKYIDDNSVVD